VSKYIIEIEDEPFSRDDDFEHYLYRAKRFKSLVFDSDGIDKLEPFDPDKYDFDEVYDEAYKNGLNDAWDAARKLAHMNADVRENIFGDDWDYGHIYQNTASEAIAKIREYEELNGSIEVGDEVRLINSTGIVTRKYYDSGIHYNVVWSSGNTGFYGESDLKKTGRRFTEIAELLKNMREGQDE